MQIEFHTPHGEVKEWIVSYVRDKLMEFHRRNRDVSRAQVYFREQEDGKVCEIDLTVYGDSLFVHRKTESYEQASRQVIDELSEKIDDQLRKRSGPPDEYTSTVDV